MRNIMANQLLFNFSRSFCQRPPWSWVDAPQGGWYKGANHSRGAQQTTETWPGQWALGVATLCGGAALGVLGASVWGFQDQVTSNSPPDVYPPWQLPLRGWDQYSGKASEAGALPPTPCFSGVVGAQCPRSCRVKALIGTHIFQHSISRSLTHLPFGYTP